MGEVVDATRYCESAQDHSSQAMNQNELRARPMLLHALAVNGWVVHKSSAGMHQSLQSKAILEIIYFCV